MTYRIKGLEPADSAIRKLLTNPAVAPNDAHNAIRGCFAARIDRNTR